MGVYPNISSTDHCGWRTNWQPSSKPSLMGRQQRTSTSVQGVTPVALTGNIRKRVSGFISSFKVRARPPTDRSTTQALHLGVISSPTVTKTSTGLPARRWDLRCSVGLPCTNGSNSWLFFWAELGGGGGGRYFPFRAKR